MIIRSMKESSNLNEKFVAGDYTKFYDKFYNDFDRVDFDRYLKKYYSKLELVNKNNKSIPTDQLALKAYELGKLGYFKMLKSPNEDKEFKDLLKDFKGRDDKPSWLSDSDMTRNWKDGLKDGKNNSPYIFESVNKKKLDLDTSFYKKDNLKYSLGDRGITDMYKDALSRFDGTYDEFIKLITNDEHRMYIKWNQLRRYASQIGKL